MAVWQPRGSWGSVWFTAWLWLRPLVKWLLRRLLRLCELQRVCYGKELGGPRTLAVEWSLSMSRSTVIRQVVALLDSSASRGALTGSNRTQMIEGSVRAIAKVKQIKSSIHPDFAPSLFECVDNIWSYRQLRCQLDLLRRTSYDPKSQQHERQLLQLWQLLQPEEELKSRVSPQWKEIGFQGEDPATDFRGMGILGLQCLLYLAEHCTDIARHLLIHSHHPQLGYSFAIVGINLSQLAWRLVDDGSARAHFYNVGALAASKSPPEERCAPFFAFFVYLFHRFDEAWLLERPVDIMQFGRVRDRFDRRIRHLLADDRTRLDVHPLVVKL